MESITPGKGERPSTSPASSSLAPSAILNERWVHENTDVYLGTITLQAKLLLEVLVRQRKIKEDLDLLMVGLWESQKAFDKIADNLGYTVSMEDMLRDRAGLENQASRVQIPGLPPSDGAEPIGEGQDCKPCEEGSIPPGTSTCGCDATMVCGEHDGPYMR